MGYLKGLTETFREKAFGTSVALATCASLVLGAVTPTAAVAHNDDGHPIYTDEIVDVFEDFARAWDNDFSNISARDGAAIHRVYENMFEFYIDYPGKPQTQGVDVNIRDQAVYLAQEFGLQNSRNFASFVEMVDLHSGIAGTYQHISDRPMDNNASPDFSATKYKAVLDIQYYAAKFLEEVAPQFEARPRNDANQYVAYYQLCRMVQQHGEPITQIQNNVAGDNGYRQMQSHEFRGDDFNRSGQITGAITCPRRP